MMNFGDAVQIAGCTSKGRHLETSSGNSSLDSLVGGAVPNTSLVVLDETHSRAYADVLVRLFLAEGAYHQHGLLTVGGEWLGQLPARIEDSGTSPAGAPARPRNPMQPDPAMKIAFRYSAVPQVNSSVSSSKNRFDLGRTCPPEVLEQCERMQWPEKGEPLSYSSLLSHLRALLTRDEYSKRVKGGKKRLLRVALSGLGGPLWSDPACLPRLLAELPQLMRHAYVVVVATVHSPGLTPLLARQLEVSADVYFRLQAISDEEKKQLPSLDKFHGYFRIVRLPRLTSAATFCPPAVDLVFELHRKAFDVKILHLPPALGDDPSPSPAHTASKGLVPQRGGCGAMLDQF